MAKSRRTGLLTRREVETVQLMMKGLTNAEIAIARGVNIKTVKFTLNTLYPKCFKRDKRLNARCLLILGFYKRSLPKPILKQIKYGWRKIPTKLDRKEAKLRREQLKLKPKPVPTGLPKGKMND